MQNKGEVELSREKTKAFAGLSRGAASVFLSLQNHLQKREFRCQDQENNSKERGAESARR